MPQLYEAFEGWKSICGRAYNLKGIKGKFSVFLLFYRSSLLGMMRADPAMVGGGDSVINKNKYHHYGIAPVGVEVRRKGQEK